MDCCQDCGRPMPGCAFVPGVESNGYLARLEFIFNEERDRQETDRKLNRLVRAMKEDLGRHLSMQQPLTIRATVQLLNTLFEVAATVSAMDHPNLDEADEAKLQALHATAMEGIQIIGAPEDSETDGSY